MWENLPDKARKDLQGALEMLPGDPKGWRRLIDRMVEGVKFAGGTKRLVTVIGPVNVGKSTLYNTLVRSKKDRAAVSPTPGTTRVSQQADAGIFVIVDTPGMDAVGTIGEGERAMALETARASDFLIVLFDAAQGIRKGEQTLFQELQSLEKPAVVALNKMDLVKKEERAQVIGRAAANLGLSSDKVLPISAKEEQGLARLLKEVVAGEPSLVAALGAALPEYRWELAQAVIGRASSAAGAIALTPLPFLDFFPLIGIQAAMVLSIARIYTFPLNLARAKELIATFGVGLLGRTLFYELTKLGGPPAWLVSAAVAAGTTYALGYASAVWFERGEKLPVESLDKVTKAISEAVVERLKELGSRRPSRVTLRERVSEALESLPAPQMGEEKDT